MKQSHLPLILLAICLTLFLCCTDKEEIKSVDFIKFSIADACEGSVLKSSTEKEKTIVITSEQDLHKVVGYLSSVPSTHILCWRVV